jgi:hypothetical protein
MKKVFNIFDNTMGESKHYVAEHAPKTFEWNWEYNPNYETFFVNFDVANPLTKQIKGYALLPETKGIIPEYYYHVEANINDYKMVFTPDSHLIEKYPEKCKWVPGYGMRVGGKNGDEEIKIHKKSKMISMVSSNKQMCELHKYRIHLANFLSNNTNSVVATVGCASPCGSNKIIDSLRDYRYSIGIENYVSKWYMTEKLFNCFATGTIPIYYGATDLGKYFNTDGVIQINGMSFNEILNLVNNLDEDFYESKMDVIKENFELVQKFKSMEDYINLNYFKKGMML